MPKPINPTIAKIPCIIRGCEHMADVRREKNHERGALYVVCPEHGRLSTNGAKYKQAIAALIEADLAHGCPGEKPEPAPEPTPAPKPEPPKAKGPDLSDKKPEKQTDDARRRGWLADALKQVENFIND